MLSCAVPSCEIRIHLACPLRFKERTLRNLRSTSALHPKADIVECDGDVRFVPKANIGTVTLAAGLHHTGSVISQVRVTPDSLLSTHYDFERPPVVSIK